MMSILPSDINFSREKISVFIVWLFQFSAIVGISFGFDDWFLSKTPVNLVIQLLLLFWIFSKRRKDNMLIVSGIFILAMAIEIVGVKTSFPFGTYEYGENLGVKILGVPILIGCNWVMLIFITSSIASKYFKSIYMRAIFGASLMILLDIPMEVVAYKFDFWHFKFQNPPLENYFSWFIISFLFHLMAQKYSMYGKGILPINIFMSQLLFFCYFAIVY